MKPKKIIILAVISIILAVFPYAADSFMPLGGKFIVSNLISIAGNFFMALLFFVLIILHKKNPSLRNPVVFGFLGYLLSSLISVLNLILDSIFNIAVNNPVKYSGLLSISLRFRGINFIIGLASTILIIASIMILFRNSNKIQLGKVCKSSVELPQA